MTEMPLHKTLQHLRSSLNRLAPGAISDAGDIERPLADCWPEFSGNDENGMEAYKLLGRMEKVEWTPPVLSFEIERHGGTVLGSTRAELHRWQVDLDRMAANCTTVGHRQVRTVADAVRQDDLQQIAEEIAALIDNGATDDRLAWKDANSVHVVIGQVISSDSGFQRTVDGRRKRFRELLGDTLAKSGWEHVGRNVYQRCAP